MPPRLVPGRVGTGAVEVRARSAAASCLAARAWCPGGGADQTAPTAAANVAPAQAAAAPRRAPAARGPRAAGAGARPRRAAPHGLRPGCVVGKGARLLLMVLPKGGERGGEGGEGSGERAGGEVPCQTRRGSWQPRANPQTPRDPQTTTAPNTCWPGAEAPPPTRARSAPGCARRAPRPSREAPVNQDCLQRPQPELVNASRPNLNLLSSPAPTPGTCPKAAPQATHKQETQLGLHTQGRGKDFSARGFSRREEPGKIGAGNAAALGTAAGPGAPRVSIAKPGRRLPAAGAQPAGRAGRSRGARGSFRSAVRCRGAISREPCNLSGRGYVW